MQPFLFNTQKRRSINILILTLIFVSAFLGTAKAGDIAGREFLGFSPDGAYFAFEEYGVQDGSGYPYSNIFITQTHENSWVKGSPIRILVKSEQVSLATARTRAISSAQSILDKYKISKTGTLLAHNPITELGRDPHEVTVAPGPVPFLRDYSLSFTLNEMPIATKRCAAYGADAQFGYELSYQRKDKKIIQIHKDSRIPTSRGCPKSYAISDIIRFQPKDNPKKSLFIVILQVLSYGFEGNDGRYLATSMWVPSFSAGK